MTVDTPEVRPEDSGVRAVWLPLSRSVRSALSLSHQRLPRLILAAILSLGTLARLAPLGLQRFHEDEALYSTWGLRIASGEDVLLSRTPVDKPPLFLYLQAGAFALFGPSETAARLPSLLASVTSIALLYLLARQLYDRPSALVTAALLAASPFAVSFAPTAFLDAVLGMWVLAACLAATRAHWVGAGAMLGLAAATKWEGVMFLPLVVGLGLYGPPAEPARPTSRHLLRMAVSLLVVAALVWGWDLARPQPSILQSVRANYGGLAPAQPALWGQRLRGWAGLLRFAFYHPWLNAAFLAGVPLLILSGLIRLHRTRASGRERPAINAERLAPSHPNSASTTPPNTNPPNTGSSRIDLLLFAFLVCYLALMTLLRVPVWDRYLLALVPLGCLLLARVLWLPQHWMARQGDTHAALARRVWPLLVVALLLFTLPLPLRDAAAGRFPIGGDHGTYQGIDQVVAYFRGHVMGGAILYHRWLGNHYRFYMFHFPYAFRWWQTPEELAGDAAAAADVERWIVFPGWQDEGPARTALSVEGLGLVPRHQAYRDDGSTSFTIYQIEGPR